MPVWTQRDGTTWACFEYDHGPFCRRCRPLDETVDLEWLRRAIRKQDKLIKELTAE